MKRLTGNYIKEKYKVYKRKNSFYQKETLNSTPQKAYTKKTRTVDISKPETLYFIDNKTGKLKAKNTLLLK